jgi:hypothetical protein
MPTSNRSSTAPSVSRRRKAAPSCRGGASSLLRLAPPVSTRQGLAGKNLSGWLTRAASVLSPSASASVQVRANEFAPSRWLVGH